LKHAQVKGSILLREKLENIKTAYIFEKKNQDLFFWARLFKAGLALTGWVKI
jgi:hypothetical protein